MSQHFLLKSARKNRGLSLRYAAEKVHIHPSTLYRYEEGLIVRIPEKVLGELYYLYGLESAPEEQEKQMQDTYRRLMAYKESRQRITADSLYERFQALDERGRQTVLSFLQFEESCRTSAGQESFQSR